MAIENMLIEICATVLKLNKEDFDLDVEFAQYGVDSIMMMKIMNLLESKFNIVMDPTAIVNYPTIALLAGYLEEEKLLIAKETSETQPTKINEQAPILTAKKQERNRFVKVETKSNKISHCWNVVQIARFNNLVEYWENLQSGKDLIGEIPAKRWNAANYFSTEKALDKAYTTKGRVYRWCWFFRYAIL